MYSYFHVVDNTVTAADTFKALQQPATKSCKNCLHDRHLHGISKDSCGVDQGFKEYQLGNMCQPIDDFDDHYGDYDSSRVYKKWEWDRKTKS